MSKKVLNDEEVQKSKASKGSVRTQVSQDAINARASTFVDRKKAYKQGKVKHKKDIIPN